MHPERAEGSVSERDAPMCWLAHPVSLAESGILWKPFCWSRSKFPYIAWPVGIREAPGRQTESACVVSDHPCKCVLSCPRKSCISCTLGRRRKSEGEEVAVLGRAGLCSRHCPGQGVAGPTQRAIVPSANGEWVCPGEDVPGPWGRKIPACSLGC